MPATKQIIRPARYASSADFEQIFKKEMNDLYFLSFLLTADRHIAEQCFVSGLEDAVGGNPVFKEWAQSWAKRMIIQNALRLTNPRRNEATARSMTAFAGTHGNSLLAEQQAITAILALDPFDRFVYVMSVLERYSDQDCSVLLGCARRDILNARLRAMQQLGNAMESHFDLQAKTEKLTLHKLSSAAIGWLLFPNLASST
jgi:DNA-directed RNA polymerase specialized sigma24 family protein